MTFVSCFTTLPRRMQVVGGLFVLGFVITIQSQVARDHLLQWPRVAGVEPMSARQQYDAWQPPYDWDGETVVYDNFPSLNEQFSFSLNDLDRDLQPSKLTLEPFPLYGQHNDVKRDSSFNPCRGPNGMTFNDSAIETITRGRGHPRYRAEASIGSSAVVGFEKNTCYDRFGRHKLYGLKDMPTDISDTEGHSEVLQRAIGFEWEKVDWADLQTQCFQLNRHRFSDEARASLARPPRILHTAEEDPVAEAPRTAIVFRTHQDYEYTEEIKRNLRAVITELALYTGGEYAAFLFVHIKDSRRDIWASDVEYQQAIDDFVPAEFRHITVLWNQPRWRKDYPHIPDDYQNVHMSQWLPMQYFQKQYPEFDYYWNWEMDIRYTGHYFDFVRAVDNFTRAQPRKGMWERNERFYIPRVHGTFEQFRESVQSRYTRDGNGANVPDSSIWGPHFPGKRISEAQQALLSTLETQPPVPSPDLDNFEWGIGEPADLMTFLPMFNPFPTRYVFHDGIRNYDGIPERDVHRRTTIITLARLSGRLLQLMEAENTMESHHHMSSETWPHSVSMHYGLKAVYVPHAIYMEQDWPSNALDFIFNNGDQGWTLTQHPERDRMDPRGEGSGGPESPFGLGIEHNWMRSTWYYQNRLAEKLYKRWMGWEYDNIGGPEWEQEHGHYCLPPMLLHPIKSLFGPEESIVQQRQ